MSEAHALNSTTCLSSSSEAAKTNHASPPPLALWFTAPVVVPLTVSPHAMRSGTSVAHASSPPSYELAPVLHTLQAVCPALA